MIPSCDTSLSANSQFVPLSHLISDFKDIRFGLLNANPIFKRTSIIDFLRKFKLKESSALFGLFFDAHSIVV